MNARVIPISVPTATERQAAGAAAAALRAAIADPSTMGARAVAHIDMRRPRRAVWITTWENLPGFSCENGTYYHASLPGWAYRRSEIVPEMILDLEALAERGVRPTEATNNG